MAWERSQPGSQPLTPDALRARRNAARLRRRRQRRSAALAGLLCVAAAASAAALLTGRSSGRPVSLTPAQSRLAASVLARVHGELRAPLRFLDGIGAGRRPHRAGFDADAAVDRVLAYTSYVALAGHRKREIALTFDDGPGLYTPQILRELKRMHVPATFFVIGREAEAFPRYVHAEARAGDAVGDHTELHPPLAELPPAAQRSELVTAAQAIHRAGAPSPILFRPPYGSFDAATIALLHRLRMLMVLWSVDTSDYTRPGVSRIIDTAVSGAQPGAIILMHDGGGDRSETVAALPRIIELLRRRGYRLVTVPRLVADDPPPVGQRPPQPLSGEL